MGNYLSQGVRVLKDAAPPNHGGSKRICIMHPEALQYHPRVRRLVEHHGSVAEVGNLQSKAKRGLPKKFHIKMGLKPLDSVLASNASANEVDIVYIHC